MNKVLIRKAEFGDFSAIHSLLAKEGLPIEGVDEKAGRYLVAKNGSKIVGAIGLEVYSEEALLRSAVVSKSFRGRGLGMELTKHILGVAKQHGVERLFLLTTTAEEFFRKVGFRKIARKYVKGPIAESSEFRALCPSTSVCMIIDLE